MKVWLLYLLAGRQRAARARDGFYGFLDNQVFPKVIAYTTHRVHISLMAVLWVALLFGGSWTAFELVGGNYTNGLSGLMTCIIALQQMRQRQESKDYHQETHRRLDEHAQKLDTLASSSPPGDGQA